MTTAYEAQTTDFDALEEAVGLADYIVDQDQIHDDVTDEVDVDDNDVNTSEETVAEVDQHVDDQHVEDIAESTADVEPIADELQNEIDAPVEQPVVEQPAETDETNQSVLASVTIEQLQAMMRARLFDQAILCSKTLTAALHTGNLQEVQNALKDVLKSITALGGQAAQQASEPVVHHSRSTQSSRNATSKAQQVRNHIGMLHNNGLSNAEVIDQTVAWAVSELNFTTQLAKTYVEQNFRKVVTQA